MHFRKRLKVRQGIDLTPMIDIVFNLLIFFMVSTTLTDTPIIKVNLPKSSEASQTEQTDAIFITLANEGKIFLNKEEVVVDELKSKLKEISLEPSATDNVVVIRADEEVPTKKLIESMDIAKSCGFNKLSIATSESQ